MNPEEYAHLKEVESKHWYYQAKRDFAKKLLLQHSPDGGDKTLLDIGPGTGIFAKAMESHFDVHALDASPHSFQYLKELLPLSKIKQGFLEDQPWPAQSFDALTALDVLEHIEDDHTAVSHMHRLLKPQGTLLLTVPASMKLWSNWDEKLHHFRRYSKQSLAQVFDPQQWDIHTLHYTNWAVFPLVYLIRKLSLGGKEGTEHNIPHPIINTLLYQQLYQTAQWKFALPFGVSLLLIAKKRGDS